MLILGLDFEATDKIPETARITEIGAILWDTETKSEVQVLSTLVWAPDYPPQSQEVVQVTGITDQMLKAQGELPIEAFSKLSALLNQASYVVAHNKEYDQTLWEKEIDQRSRIPWFCTMTGLPVPEKFRCRKLSHMALDHGIPVDPAKLHRALDDVGLMLQLLACYDFERVIAYAKEPSVILQANTTVPWRDGGKSNQIAKDRGYRWQDLNGEKYLQKWVKSVKESQVKAEISGAQEAGLLVSLYQERN